MANVRRRRLTCHQKKQCGLADARGLLNGRHADISKRAQGATSHGGVLELDHGHCAITPQPQT
jgi:hypothetical protein